VASLNKFFTGTVTVLSDGTGRNYVKDSEGFSATRVMLSLQMITNAGNSVVLTDEF